MLSRGSEYAIQAAWSPTAQRIWSTHTPQELATRGAKAKPTAQCTLVHCSHLRVSSYISLIDDLELMNMSQMMLLLQIKSLQFLSAGFIFQQFSLMKKSLMNPYLDKTFH
jgi:hypothetical protein